MIIYIVYKSQGGYDDYFEINIKGFLSKEGAEDFVDKLTKEKNRVVGEEKIISKEYDLDDFVFSEYGTPLYILMVKDFNECCRMIKESNLYDKNWLEEDTEYHISELEVDDIDILKDCLDLHNYQSGYINFLLGGCSEEEFMKITRAFAKPIKPGESMWVDPFDRLKTVVKHHRE